MVCLSKERSAPNDGRTLWADGDMADVTAWRQTDHILRQTVLLMDANVRLGSIMTISVGDREAKKVDEADSPLHELLASGWVLPATFCEGGTTCREREIRIDYVGLADLLWNFHGRGAGHRGGALTTARHLSTCCSSLLATAQATKKRSRTRRRFSWQ